MKKTFVTIFTIILLTSCSNKLEDFIGVHKFYSMESYLVKDTSERIKRYFSILPLSISVNRIAPMKIDVFKSGEELKATFTITKYQTSVGLDEINQFSETKLALTNIHLINDTLIAEYITSRIDYEFKLSKSGNKYSLIVPTNDIKDEECNQFAKVINKNVIYNSVESSDNMQELINQSNSCAVEKSLVRTLENGYKKEKVAYLKRILSVDPNLK
jgi:hypothetical protein